MRMLNIVYFGFLNPEDGTDNCAKTSVRNYHYLLVVVVVVVVVVQHY